MKAGVENLVPAASKVPIREDDQMPAGKKSGSGNIKIKSAATIKGRKRNLGDTTDMVASASDNFSNTQGSSQPNWADVLDIKINRHWLPWLINTLCWLRSKKVNKDRKMSQSQAGKKNQARKKNHKGHKKGEKSLSSL